MKKSLLSLTICVLPLFCTEYLTNKSCNECHPDIYEEYQHSWHSKTWFNDKLHRKVANKIPVYDCARCHMPAAKNKEQMAEGKVWPNASDKRETDAISCFYCHQIAYVKKAHKFDQITLARQAEGYKPSLYGSLENPDENDKHASVKSPIYDKYACMGCHAHKRNNQGVLIFQAMRDDQTSESCIKCHMPKTPGPAEKMNKRAREHHHSHDFAGIHDSHMRSKGLDMAVETAKDEIRVTLTNKMGHPLIIQPARLKYLELKIIRDGKVIWRNFEKSPKEDAQGAFYIDFADKKGNLVPIPYFAEKILKSNNLDEKESRTLRYKVPSLRKDDKIVATMYVILAKPACASAAGVRDRELTEPLLMKRVEKIVQ